MIDIYFCLIKEKLLYNQWEYYFNLLPASEKVRNKKYLRWEDQHSHLFGRLLLQTALIKHGYTSNILNHLQFNSYQKPFLNENIHFNISHSGQYIACAISREIKIGFDIELKLLTIDILDYQEIFSMREWRYLTDNEVKAELFYKLWTRKESIVKANGRGLQIPLNEVDVLNKSATLENKIWFINDLELDAKYSACLATNIMNYQTTLIQLDFYN